ncbi:hypothetical protein GJ496_001789 [Pomphorhynchus laevis]|nr:hypothetical protein GJ496_001789 [Pomphorhynchus laevis]
MTTDTPDNSKRNPYSSKIRKGRKVRTVTDIINRPDVVEVDGKLQHVSSIRICNEEAGKEIQAGAEWRSSRDRRHHNHVTSHVAASRG